jgi:hypothetical protein
VVDLGGESLAACVLELAQRGVKQLAPRGQALLIPLFAVRRSGQEGGGAPSARGPAKVLITNPQARSRSMLWFCQSWTTTPSVGPSWTPAGNHARGEDVRRRVADLLRKAHFLIPNPPCEPKASGLRNGPVLALHRSWIRWPIADLARAGKNGSPTGASDENVHSAAQPRTREMA